MTYSTVVVFIILCTCVHFGLQCSKSKCTGGPICMHEPPTAFVNSTVQVCCSISNSLAGWPVHFRCFDQRRTVQTTVESRDVCSTFFVNSRNNKGILCHCGSEMQTACQDSHLIFSEISFPESLSVQCYTQFPHLVCHWWPVLDFQVKQRNVTVTLLWDELYCTSSGKKSTVCTSECRLDLVDVLILQNDCLLNVSIIITYNQRSPHLPRSVSSPWLEVNPSILEKLRPYNLRITDISSTCLTLQWSMYISDYFDNKTLTFITLESRWKKVKINKTEYDHRTERVCGLSPFTRYNISLLTRLEQGTVWSDTVTATAVTEADVPMCGPQVTPGGHDIIKTDQTYYAVVYWKLPSEREWHGESDLGFNVYIEHGQMKQTLKFDKDTFYAKVSLAESDVTSLYVKSKNAVGEANCSVSEFKLTAAKKESPVSNVHSTWVDDSVQVSWVFKTGGNYKVTVYWCQRSNETDLCHNPVNWKEQSDVRQLSMKLRLPLVESQLNQYGVSVLNIVTMEVSEIIWTACFKSYQDGKELQFGLCDVTVHQDVNDSILAVLLPLFFGILFVIVLVIFIRHCYLRHKDITQAFLNTASAETPLDLPNQWSGCSSTLNQKQSKCQSNSFSSSYVTFDASNTESLRLLYSQNPSQGSYIINSDSTTSNSSTSNSSTSNSTISTSCSEYVRCENDSTLPSTENLSTCGQVGLESVTANDYVTQTYIDDLKSNETSGSKNPMILVLLGFPVWITENKNGSLGLCRPHAWSVISKVVASYGSTAVNDLMRGQLQVKLWPATAVNDLMRVNVDKHFLENKNTIKGRQRKFVSKIVLTLDVSDFLRIKMDKYQIIPYQ
ncbi:hypothetical protein Btru_039655 [Bulinus truncatus]|nr:hypothetical protein Btru_039655 [Bulinus truncatus]